jgi:hypothetical protein
MEALHCICSSGFTGDARLKKRTKNKESLLKEQCHKIVDLSGFLPES